MVNCDYFTLDNGLRVVHNYNPQTAMAVVNVLYDVGARDEDADHTGMAHLFEHLMFGGSANVASFDSALEMAGGKNNAFTGNDFTVFYDVVPAQNVETAFYLESDRMLALAFSDKALEVQRHVVVEEFKQVCLNRPYGKLMHYMRPLLFGSHPYSWPVIGIKPEHIEQVTQADVRKWFYSHYAPNNAVLAVTGNVPPERVRELAEKWFGPIPRRDIAVRDIADTPWPSGDAVVKTVRDNVPQPLIAVAYRMAAYGERGYLAADAITDILSAGKSARFFQRLVMGSDLFATADAFISGSQHSGFLMLSATLNDDSDDAITRAKDMLIEQARQLAEHGNVSQYELERSKNRYESNFTFENVNLVNLAQTLCQCVYNHEDINEVVSKYRALTLSDITDTAKEVFIDHAPAIVVYRPLQ